MRRLDRWINYAGNHRSCFSFGIILIVIHLVLVAERVYQYRHSGAWIVIARSSAQCLHLDCALVLLLTLRRSFTWLRSRGMDWLLPLDRTIYFHKMIGWLICVFSVVHTLAHIINYGIKSRANGAKMRDYLFDKTAGWIPGMVTPSGFALLFILLIMGLFSHRLVRKSGRFELFYWTHMLCLPFFLLMIMHAGNAWKWLIGPLCLFGAEIGYRIGFICCSERGRTKVTSLQLLPNQVVRLKIERPPYFEYNAGDYVYVNIPHVARFEWHPFTISSAPEDEDYMTLHVRVAGGWTGRLYSMCQEDAARLERQQSRHRIVQQQLDSKLSAFQSMPMTLEKSTVAVGTGQDNPAFHEQESTSLPALNTEVAISIISTPEPRSNCKDLLPIEMPIMLDGPYSGSAMRAWNCRHALFIAGGIGVTPFASLLQSLVSRYHSSMNACPHCHQSCCTNVPSSLGKLRHVDFMWVNRDLLSFQWFLELLLDLDKEQSIRGSVMENFLDIQLFQTGTKTMPDPHQPCASCCESLAVIPQIQANLLDDGIVQSAPASQVTGRCPYCTIRQVKHLLNYGRPVWDEVFREVALRSGGRVTVFYCGPASMARVVMAQCKKFGFTFTKEIS